jgi:quinohemoprotein amine dehydrogenase
MAAPGTLILLLCALSWLLPAQTDEGIPITDSLVIAKCGSCHLTDQQGNMQRLSWERTTPEGWEGALKRMIRANGVTLTPLEARSIVKYLSSSHGLAPEEAKPLLYYTERRIRDESGMVDDDLSQACAKCHSIARPLLWRRSMEDWKQFATAHALRYNLKPNDRAIDLLSKAAPLQSPEWKAWSAHPPAADLAGRWLVTAHVQGRGTFFGEMEIQPGSSAGEFTSRVSLQSVVGASIVRTGRNVVYGGYAWRGRSKGISPAGSAPDDLSSEAREVMWVAPDGAKAEGRWFWGQYQEFGFDVKMQRASEAPALLGTDLYSLKIGSRGNRIRLIGDHFPAKILPADLDFGPGLTVRRIVASAPNEITVEVDADPAATPGKRSVAFMHSSVLPDAIALYDRIDYVKVTPESSLAGFGSRLYPRGFQQFEAIGYQRGTDGRLHTADDLELGPVDVSWSLEVFYETDTSKQAAVGTVSSTGFFTPAAESPNVNYDVWVVATAKDAMNKDGKPLVGKGYMVVTVASYTFNGREYVRDLDHWIEEGTR